MGSEHDFLNYPSNHAESDESHESVDNPLSTRGALPMADIESLDDADFTDVGKDVQKSAEDTRRIIEQIKTVVLFEGYDDEDLHLVANYMYRRAVTSGEVVIKFGADGDAFYVVKRGSFLCTVPGPGGTGSVPVCEYQDSGCFGELALINRVPRAATVQATSDAELWVLCAMRCSWLRKRQAERNADICARVITGIPIFRDNLDSGHVNRLIDAVEVATHPAGAVICTQGQPGDAMYFILAGEIEALINGRPVKVLRENEFFGERALVLEEGRAATCRATKVTKLAKLPKDSFQLLIPDGVVDKMKAHIATTYGQKAPVAVADNEDDDGDSSGDTVYMEYQSPDSRE